MRTVAHLSLAAPLVLWIIAGESQTPQLHGCPLYNFTSLLSTGGFSYDWFDAKSGIGTCAGFVTAGLPCDSPAVAGKCDYTCNLCQPVDRVQDLPSCSPFRNSYPSTNYWDSWDGPRACDYLLLGSSDASSATACADLYCDNCTQPHRCDQTCGYCVPQPPESEQTLADCVAYSCQGTSPLWMRIAGARPVGTPPWTRPQDCVDFFATIDLTNASHEQRTIEVPTRTRNIVRKFHANDCGTDFASWYIQYGTSTPQDCLAAGSPAHEECRNLQDNQHPPNMCESFDDWLEQHADYNLNSSDCSVNAFSPRHLGPQGADSSCSLRCQPGYEVTSASGLSPAIRTWSYVCNRQTWRWRLDETTTGGYTHDVRCRRKPCFTTDSLATSIQIPFATVRCQVRTHPYGERLEVSEGGSCTVQCNGQLAFRDADCAGRDQWIALQVQADCGAHRPWSCGDDPSGVTGRFSGTKQCLPPPGSCAAPHGLVNGSMITNGQVLCDTSHDDPYVNSSQCLGDGGRSSFHFFVSSATVNVRCNVGYAVSDAAPNAAQQQETKHTCADGRWLMNGGPPGQAGLLELPHCQQLAESPCTSFPPNPPRGTWRCSPSSVGHPGNLRKCDAPSGVHLSGSQIMLDCGGLQVLGGAADASPVCTDGSWSSFAQAACSQPSQPATNHTPEPEPEPEPDHERPSSDNQAIPNQTGGTHHWVAAVLAVAAAVGVLAAAAWVRPWRHCNVMRKNFVSEELYAELFAIDRERAEQSKMRETSGIEMNPIDAHASTNFMQEEVF